jgi:tetratricopeptide (TPR) repeat protein
VSGTGFVGCASCGARIKANRQLCLRCGEPLRPVDQEPQAPSASGPFRLPGRTALSLGAAASLAVAGLVAILWQTRPQHPDHVAQVAAPPTSTGAPSPPRQGGGSPTRSAGDEPQTFVEGARAGGAAFAAGDFGSARAAYERALEKQPDDPEALNGLGQTLVRLGRAGEAIPRFERAVQLAPDTWTYRFNLARAAGELGQWDRAADEYRAAARIFPDDYATQYNLALALHKKGDEEAAIPEYEKAIALAPGEPSFHISLGVSFEKLGRVADAIREYRVFLQMDPSSADAGPLKTHVDALSATTTATAASAAVRPGV